MATECTPAFPDHYATLGVKRTATVDDITQTAGIDTKNEGLSTISVFITLGIDSFERKKMKAAKFVLTNALYRQRYDALFVEYDKKHVKADTPVVKSVVEDTKASEHHDNDRVDGKDAGRRDSTGKGVEGHHDDNILSSVASLSLQSTPVATRRDTVVPERGTQSEISRPVVNREYSGGYDDLYRSPPPRHVTVQQIPGTVCSRCGRYGHPVERCFSNTTIRNDRCYRCNQYGHWSSNCPN